MADGDLQARMNVVHEAGLFQGRLGFTKAIVLSSHRTPIQFHTPLWGTPTGKNSWLLC